MIISLLSVEFHLKVAASDEASKIPDSLRIREDINEFASCEERTKLSKNLKIVLFHYSQLDFRKCLKAPKTVPKWHDQLNSSSNATCVNSKSNLYSKSNSSSNANSSSNSD